MLTHQVLIYIPYPDDPGNDYNQDPIRVANRLAEYDGAVNFAKFTSNDNITDVLSPYTGVDLIELVGDGSPDGCAGIDMTNAAHVGAFIQNNFSENTKFVLNGC